MNRRGLTACVLALIVFVLTAAACQSAPPPTLRARVASRVPDAINSTPTPIGRALPTDPAIRQQLNAIQSDRLIFAVDSLVKLQTRHVLSPVDDPAYGIGAARAFLLNQFNTLHATSPLMIWTQPIPFTLNGVLIAPENVVAVLQGTDVDAGVIVVGAHYDSLASVDFYNGKAPAPGANANGSGVAALLEIAHIMAATPHRATLMFVAFSAEETGRQGSIAFVKHYLQAQDPPIVPRAVINLDTLGSNTAADGEPGPETLRVFSAEPNDSPSRQLARQIQLIASAYLETPTVIVQSSEERLGRFGDQQSFSAEGYAAIRLIEGVEDASRQRSQRDTIDSIRPAYLMSATRVGLAALLILADGPDAPGGLALRLSDVPTLTWTAESGASGYVVTLRQAASLHYDQVFVTSSLAELSWSELPHDARVAIAAVDQNGRMGPLSAETSLSALEQR